MDHFDLTRTAMAAGVFVAKRKIVDSAYLGEDLAKRTAVFAGVDAITSAFVNPMVLKFAGKTEEQVTARAKMSAQEKAAAKEALNLAVDSATLFAGWYAAGRFALGGETWQSTLSDTLAVIAVRDLFWDSYQASKMRL